MHRLDEPPRDGQTQPDAGPTACPVVVETLERREHLLTIIDGNARATVDHAHLDDVPDRTGSDPDGLIGRSVSQRVFDQVGDDAFQQARVGGHLRQGSWDVYLHQLPGPVGDDRPDMVESDTDDFVEIYRTDRDREDPGL